MPRKAWIMAQKEVYQYVDRPCIALGQRIHPADPNCSFNLMKDAAGTILGCTC